MSFQINPNLIESNDVTITENADGDLELTHRASGESVTLGSSGFSTASVDADSAAVTNTVTAGAVDTDAINNIVHANSLSGATLAEKVETALSTLAGSHGRIVISQRDDGTPWSWGSDVIIDPNNYNGFEIDIVGPVEIEYPGSGVPLTIDGNGSLQLEGGHVTITGGVWKATGTDPTGCFRIKDAFRTEIKPHHVQDFSNSSSNGFGVSIENHDTFCENSHIGGRYLDCDISIDFKPGSVTGGTAGESFQDTFIENVHMGIQETGIRLRGAHRDTTVLNPTAILRGDGSLGYLFDGNMRGCVVYSPEVENPSDTATGNVGYRTGSNYAERVIVIGGNTANGVETEVDDANGPILTVQQNGTGFGIGPLGSGNVFRIAGNGSLKNIVNIDLNESLLIHDGLHTKEQDLTGVTGDVNRQILYDDGSGGNAEGYYRWDAGNSQWVKIEDNTVTI